MKKLGKIMLGSLIAGMTLGIAFMIMTANIGDGVMVEHRRMREVTLQGIGDATPVAGGSGWLHAYIVALNAFPYTSNISVNASVFASGDVNNSHLGSNVPFNTNLAFAVKVRWNKTHAFNAVNNTWMHSWVEGWFNSSVMGISTYECDEYNITSTGNGDFIWMHYVCDNNGSGYTIAQGFNITSLAWNFNAYY